MSSYTGAFRYLDANGAEMQKGPCRVSIEPPDLYVTPTGGPSVSFDLGDIDVLLPGEYELTLVLYTGKSIVLSKFARTFQNLSAELVQSYRDRLVECLLLDDLEELARFEGYVDVEQDGDVAAGTAELRLHKSNIAVLPWKGVPFQWRLADIDGIEFDSTAYRVTVNSGENRLLVTKLAKRTDEFVERLRSALDSVSERSSAIIRALWPFLSPDQVLESAGLMKEGRAVALSRLKAVDPRTEDSLIINAVDTGQKPYFEFLREKSSGLEWFTGFKMVRPDAETVGDPGREPAAAWDSAPPGRDVPADADGPKNEGPGEGERDRSVLHWFFFPMATAAQSVARGQNVIAWEATSLSGRATYFFRMGNASEAGFATPLSAGLEATVARLNQGLVLLNFRREPVYLSEESLETTGRYRRYAIACRKIRALRELRASYLGRAIHTSADAWQRRVEEILAVTLTPGCAGLPEP